MMNSDTRNQGSPGIASRWGWVRPMVMVICAAAIATVIAVWVITHYIFPAQLRPVTLSSSEERVLDAKVKRLSSLQQEETQSHQPPESTEKITLKPERYSEDGAGREITLSEKEINALLARNSDLARKLAIDLDDDVVSMKLLIPVEEGVPFLGGKTILVTAGVELSYTGGRPVVALKGVSLWGIPLPNAWLGNMKNIDLVKEYGAGKGFWHSFAAGVDGMKVEKGILKIRLKE